MDDVVEGAALVLKTALSAIPSAAGLVHLADAGAREFVVVAAAGTRNTELVGTRTSESDLLLDKALRDTDSVVVAQGSLELATTRFGLVSPERSVLCAPAQYDGQKLGAIELVDPQRTAAFTAADRHAMTYVGERFAEFLADRSISF
jgi:GAF domain-containing protein